MSKVIKLFTSCNLTTFLFAIFILGYWRKSIFTSDFNLGK